MAQNKDSTDLPSMIKRIFPDETIKNNLFGQGNLKTAINDPKKIVQRANSMFNLTQGFFYSKYREWRDRNQEKIVDITDIHACYKGLTNSTLRVLYVMDELYYKYSLNNDIVSYLLINTQMNITDRTPQDSSLDDILNIPVSLAIVDGDDDAFISRFTAEHTKLARNIRYIPPVKKDDYEAILYHFSFYRTVEVEVEEDGNVLFVTIDDIKGKVSERVNSHHTVICENGMLYLLTDIRRLNNVYEDDTLRVTYKSIYDGSTLIFNVGDSENDKFGMSGTEFFMDVTGRDIPNDYSPELFFRGLNTGSYKYVNRLGMAIVDSVYGMPEALICLVKLIKSHWDELNLEELDPELSLMIGVTQKGDLLESLKNKNNTNFSVNEIKWSSSKRWDDIVVRLLIIKSPREVMAAFIESCHIFGPSLENFLGKIRHRFDNMVDTDAIMHEMDKEMKVAEHELLLLNFGRMGISEAQIDKWVTKTNALIMSRLVVHALSELTSNKIVGAPSEIKEAVGGSIYPRELLLRDLDERMKSGEAIDPNYVINRSEFILRQSLKTALCTFDALLASLDEWSEFEIVSYGSNLSQDKISTYQSNIQEAFFTELEKSVIRYSNWASEDLFKELVRKCNDCYDSERSLVKELGTMYYIMTGKTTLIDLKCIDSDRLKVDGDGNPYVPNQDRPNEPLRFDFIRSECKNGSPLSKKYARSYLVSADHILRLLGGCYESIDTFNDLTQKSAYPFVGTYVDNRRNMDGHNICNFAIRNNIGETTRIHILSEMEYNLNKKYYIIPNLQRTDREWWIQPFMIECERFNEIITAGLNEEERKDAISDERKTE